MHNIQVFSVCPVLPFIWLQSQFIRGIGPTKSNVAKFSFYLCCRNYTTYILKVHLYHLKTIGSIHWTQPQFSIWLNRQAYEILNIYMYCIYMYIASVSSSTMCFNPHYYHSIWCLCMHSCVLDRYMYQLKLQWKRHTSSVQVMIKYVVGKKNKYQVFLYLNFFLLDFSSFGLKNKHLNAMFWKMFLDLIEFFFKLLMLRYMYWSKKSLNFHSPCQGDCNCSYDHQSHWHQHIYK